MSVCSKYIGPVCDYTDTMTGRTLHLETNESYSLDIRQDGPVMVVNGQRVVHPDATIWLMFEDGAIQMPYSIEALPKQWEGLYS